MGESVEMEDIDSTLIKNGEAKVVFTKNKSMTTDEDDETKVISKTEEDNVSLDWNILSGRSLTIAKKN